MANNKEKGDYGERLAAKALAMEGYQIRTKNYRGYFGEIDLIVEKDGIIVFVEVKLRTGTAKGMPKEAVNRAKQRKIAKTAVEYLAKERLDHRDCRFDVVEILYQEQTPFYHHIENAFWIGA